MIRYMFTPSYPTSRYINQVAQSFAESASAGTGELLKLLTHILRDVRLCFFGAFEAWGGHWSSSVNYADCVFERQVEVLPAIRRYVTDQLFSLWVDVELSHVSETEMMQLQGRAWDENGSELVEVVHSSHRLLLMVCYLRDVKRLKRSVAL